MHVNMKNAVVRAAETDTLMINQHNGRPVRVLRTKTTETFEGATSGDPMALLGNTLRLYQDGDFDGTLPQMRASGRADRRGAAGARDHRAHRRRIRANARYSVDALPRSVGHGGAWDALSDPTVTLNALVSASPSFRRSLARESVQGFRT